MNELFFDLDGPILDISPKFYKIYCDIFSRFGYPTISSADYWQQKRTRTPIPKIVELTAPADFAPAYIKERLAVIENPEYLAFDVVQPHILELLSRLRGKIPLILVTLRNKRKHLYWELEHFQLLPLFDAVLTKEDNHGDYQIKVELIEEYLQGRRAEGLIIGDTESDVKAGEVLRIPSVAVTCGIRTKEYLQALNPTYIIDSMDQLWRIIVQECHL